MWQIFKRLRGALTAAWFLLAVIVGTVFRQNIEELAASKGLNVVLRDWWQVMTDLGYEYYFLYGFLILTGAVAALWADYGLRRWATKSEARASRAMVAIKTSETWHDAIKTIQTENVYSFYYSSGAELTLSIVFNKPIDGGYIGVIATSTDLKWKELHLDERWLVVELLGDFIDAEIIVEVTTAAANVGKRRQEPNVEHDAILIEDSVEILLSPPSTEQKRG